MHETPHAIVFDLDGTLIDSRGDIVAATNHALVRTGRPALAAQVIVGLVGDGARALLGRAAQLAETSSDVDELLAYYTDYYIAHPIELSRWTPSAQEALEALSSGDLPLALCTNKPRAITDAVLGALGVRTRFRATYAGGDGPERKPAGGPLLSVAAQLGVDPTTLVMVGDGSQDVESARRVGCRVVGVATGYLPRERLIMARPDVLIETLGELPTIVRRWCDSTARLSVVR